LQKYQLNFTTIQPNGQGMLMVNDISLTRNVQ